MRLPWQHVSIIDVLKKSLKNVQGRAGRVAGPAERQEVFKRVEAFQQQGIPLDDAAGCLGYSCKTIQRYKLNPFGEDK